MDDIIKAIAKAIATILPFLTQCPSWVRILVVIWVFFTALISVAILICVLWPKPNIHIIKPETGAEVEEGTIVSFNSTYGNLNHYIIVIPMRSPDKWVVDGPIKVSKDGFATGRARFGSGTVGVGENFAIQVYGTEIILPEGILSSLPPESKLSQQVLVTRVK
jgi:hypothetical protein